MKKSVQVVLFALVLIVAGAPGAVNAQPNDDCWEGVICPVPWNPSNCAPFTMVDCMGCVIVVQMP